MKQEIFCDKCTEKGKKSFLSASSSQKMINGNIYQNIESLDESIKIKRGKLKRYCECDFCGLPFKRDDFANCISFIKANNYFNWEHEFIEV